MIVYAVVARGTVVLAEYTQSSGNFPTVTRVLLAKIPSNDARMSYVYDEHVFHYLVDDGVTYLCMADETTRRRVAFAFLEDAKLRFAAGYASIAHRAPAFTMNEEFGPVLERQMAYYNNADVSGGAPPAHDHADIARVKTQLDDVKHVMVENIEKVLERGERIELLVDKTDRLNQQAFKFEKTSKQLREAIFWRKVKVYATAALVVGVVVLIITMWGCGGVTFPHCRGTPHDDDDVSGAGGGQRLRRRAHQRRTLLSLGVSTAVFSS
mmetsp:Transcript_18765/g.74893  ORF Transcript_18765/g.74893 Transcript_18765/m.74893 type:complete len:267 (-) Transcript_18765:80-880(-)